MSYMLITIDVEDWFQVENFKKYIPYSSWRDHELRVEKNTHRLLDLFDSIDFNPESEILSPEPHKKVHATFFVLGWIAERLPHLIREIHHRGHEIASHGYRHNLCVESSTHELREDMINSKRLLEDITGDKIYGYRAPSFSINDDILKIIRDSGYLYDSSYNSFSLHGRYGRIYLNRDTAQGIAYKISENFYELPISNIRLLNRQSTIINHQVEIPWGGGGYFRLIPFTVFKRGVWSIMKKDGAYLFYLHPWEIDPEQPRVKRAPVSLKFRHYVNIKRTYSRLSNLIETCSSCRFVTCNQYVGQFVS